MIVSNKSLIEISVYLHPADVLNDFYVVQGGLLELKKLGCLLHNG